MATSAPEPPSTGLDPSQPPSQLSILLELQDKDLELDRLSYRRRELAERATVGGLEASLAEVTARARNVQAERDKLANLLDGFDKHSESVGARIDAIEQRLHSGRAGSYRDEQAMGEEEASLGRQRREIEDQELEVMEALESLDQELAVFEAARVDLVEGLAVAREQLSVADAGIDDEWAAVSIVRDGLAAKIEPDLADRYERLRSKLGGVGAAHIVGGACSGCHLMVPAGELHRLRQAAAGEVVYCDQCGRILVG
jgi:predicted  nucleic acid-binding Zn-ribbon protein